MNIRPDKVAPDLEFQYEIAKGLMKEEELAFITWTLRHEGVRDDAQNCYTTPYHWEGGFSIILRFIKYRYFTMRKHRQVENEQLQVV